MSKRPATLTTMSATAILVLGAGLAAAQGAHGTREQHNDGTHRSSGDHYYGGDRTIAAASLEAVGAASGWGRIVAMDLRSEDGTERVVVVHLFDLASGTEYGVWADGVLLGNPVTDANGDAWFRLSSADDAVPAPPEALPPADALVSAEVVDLAAAPTLRGNFVVMIQGDGGNGQLSYMERIVLDPVESYSVHGMARVLRGVDDRQLFETQAAGLEPGASYHVLIDDILAGVVNADGVGHGRLVLASDSESSPLPSELQPIEELRQLRWTTAGGAAVLAGSFSGVNMVGSGDGPMGGGGPHGDGGGGPHGDGGGGPHGDGDGGPGDGDGSGGGGPGDGDGDGDCDGDGPHGGGGGRP